MSRGRESRALTAAALLVAVGFAVVGMVYAHLGVAVGAAMASGISLFFTGFAYGEVRAYNVLKDRSEHAEGLERETDNG